MWQKYGSLITPALLLKWPFLHITAAFAVALGYDFPYDFARKSVLNLLCGLSIPE